MTAEEAMLTAPCSPGPARWSLERLLCAILRHAGEQGGTTSNSGRTGEREQHSDLAPGTHGASGSCPSVTLPRANHCLRPQIYVQASEDAFSACAIAAIGTCAQRVPSVTAECLKTLIKLAQGENGG